MARGKPFQKGNTFGKGRPPIPDDLKNVDKVTTETVHRVFSKYAGMTREQIRRLLEHPATPALEVMLGSIIGKAIKEGDHLRMNFVLDRLVGKVKDVSEVTMKVDLPSVSEAKQILDADYALLEPGKVEVEEL